MSRLFVGLWPDEDVLSRLAEVPRPEVDGLRWTTPDQWHVTLQFLGDRPEREMVERLERERWGVDPFRVRLGPRSVLLGGENVVLPAAGASLDRLATRVSMATGVRRTNRFRGHLTLARARNRVSKTQLAELVGASFEGEWTVGEMTLVRSSLDPGGARYETVTTMKLSRN